MKQSFQIAVIACLLVFTDNAAAGAAKPAGKFSTAQVNKLIQQLNDDKFAQREAAMEQLLNTGQQTIPLLKKALENRKIAPETSQRIKYLLGHLEGPTRGVVWRGVLKSGFTRNLRAKTPEGIQPGDIIIQIADVVIDSEQGELDFFRDSNHYCQNPDHMHTRSYKEAPDENLA